LRRRVLQGGHDAAEDQLGKGGCYLAMHLPIGLHVLPHRVLLLAALVAGGKGDTNYHWQSPPAGMIMVAAGGSPR